MTQLAAWWEGGALAVGDTGLTVAGQSVDALAREHGTPLYVYDGARIRERVRSLHDAFTARALRGRIYYAMKANRHLPLLGVLRGTGSVGIDACSPREVRLALDAGFSASEISVTASCLTATDLEAFARAGCNVNLDNVSAIRSYAKYVQSGTAIGLRVDTGAAVGYGKSSQTSYGGGKLGLDAGDVLNAAKVAAENGLVVDTLHTHLGWGLRASDAEAMAHAFRVVAGIAAALPGIRTINVGGGLGGRLLNTDVPISVDVWADTIVDVLSGLDVTIACEPGTYLVADAGILVAEVARVWEKQGVHWAGINASQSVNVYAAYYGLPFEIIPVSRPHAPPERRYAIAGNVNESGDVFARDRELPVLAEGELVALFPAGAYGASMASDHCLRGDFNEVLL